MANQNFRTGDVTAQTVVYGNHNHVSAGSPSTGPGPHRRPVFGIATALPEEFAAVRALLDDPGKPVTVDGDRALYVLGTLPSRDDARPHEVVLTLLGDTGNTA